MKERPILFNGSMVRAILDGLKTVTRRLVKPQPGDWQEPIECDWYSPLRVDHHGNEYPGPDVFGFASEEEGQPCPVGGPGDRLWVRETWRVLAWHEGDPLTIQFRCDGQTIEDRIGEVGTGDYDNLVEKLIDQSAEDCERAGLEHNPDVGYTFETNEAPTRWRPSIHMPRWASRITLEVTGVRVERVQEISRHDAESEGVVVWRESLNEKQEHLAFNAAAARCDPDNMVENSHWFSVLWNQINAKSGNGWDANPRVWVVEFRRVAQ